MIKQTGGENKEIKQLSLAVVLTQRGNHLYSQFDQT